MLPLLLAACAEAKSKAINEAVQAKDDAMRKLQLQMEQLAAERDADLGELAGVMKKGVADGKAAGVKQVRCVS